MLLLHVGCNSRDQQMNIFRFCNRLEDGVQKGHPPTPATDFLTLHEGVSREMYFETT